MIVDADAHVVETEQTWSYMDGSDKKFRPQLFSSADNPNMQYWFCEGKAVGFRPPTLTEQELIALSKETGRELNTAAGARELRDIECGFAHMDRLGIDVQILSTPCGSPASPTRPTLKSPSAAPGIAGWPTSGRRQEIACAIPASSGDDAQRSAATNTLRQRERRGGGKPAALRK